MGQKFGPKSSGVPGTSSLTVEVLRQLNLSLSIYVVDVVRELVVMQDV